MGVAEDLNKNSMFRQQPPCCGSEALELIVKGSAEPYIRVSDCSPDATRYNPYFVSASAFFCRPNFVWSNDVLCPKKFYSAISGINKEKIRDAVLNQLNEELNEELKDKFKGKKDFSRADLEGELHKRELMIEGIIQRPLRLVLYTTGNSMIGMGVCAEQKISQNSPICINAGVISKDMELKFETHLGLYIESMEHPIFSANLGKLEATIGYMNGEHFGNFGCFLLHAPWSGDLNDLFSVSEKIKGEVAVANVAIRVYSYKNWPVQMVYAISEIGVREALFMAYNPACLCLMEYLYGIETRIFNKRGGVIPKDDYRCLYINLRKISSKTNNFVYFRIKLKDAMELVLENKSFKICEKGEEFNLTKESLLEILKDKLQLIKEHHWEERLDVCAIEMLLEAIELRKRLDNPSITFQERYVLGLKCMLLRSESNRNIDEVPYLQALQETASSCPCFKNAGQTKFTEEELNHLYSKIAATLCFHIPKDALKDVRKEFGEISAEYMISNSHPIFNSVQVL